MRPTSPSALSALKKRQDLQSRARSIDVSESYISELVDRFYDRVRSDPDLGPVFEAGISRGWPAHMERMKLFWSSVALRSGIYLGKPVEAHLLLRGVKPEHFETWLRLFEEALKETAPNDLVVEHFMGFARNIARRLEEVMFP